MRIHQPSPTNSHSLSLYSESHANCSPFFGGLSVQQTSWIGGFDLGGFDYLEMIPEVNEEFAVAMIYRLCVESEWQKQPV